jgi:hypothetical protein
MKSESYKNDHLFLVERKILESRKILSESCEGLDLEQRAIVEGIYNEFEPLIRKVSLLEQTLTADQIKQLFTSIEHGATAAGGNRTMLGKGKDVASKANEIVNNVGKWLQNTTPVKAFDQKFEDLKAQIKEKLGGDDSAIVGGLQKLGELAKENPGKTAAIVGILTAIASVAGGPVGGAIAGQVLRGSVELLKGEKLSTAVGKGVKTAVLGFIAGSVAEKLGEWMSGLRANAVDFNDGLTNVTFSGSSEMSGPGWSWTRSFERNGFVVMPEDKESILRLIDEVNSGTPGAFDKLYNFAQEINLQDYKDAMAAISAGAKEHAVQNDAMWKALQAGKEAMQAASQGAVAAAGVAADGEKKKPAATPTEALLYNLRPLSEAQTAYLFKRITETNHAMITEGVIWEAGNEPKGQKPSFMQKVMGKAGEIGKNLTTKTTASKLMSAWKKAGSPADSDTLADFLKQQGVNDQVIADTYAGMQLPPPGKGAGMAELANIKKEIEQLGPKTRQQLTDFLNHRLGAA